MEILNEYKLTKYSHGGGCGCKISPAVLEEILKTDTIAPIYQNLLVGNSSKDDAAAFDIGNDLAIISTTDFFMPIVNDAYDFGKIASANAISDVYAMGGKPIMAIAILGWPVNTLPVSVAQKVLEGARAICKEAGIPLAGGHSIDTPEPIFGLSVNGICSAKNIKRNNTAKTGNYLFLTKPIGVGIMATAGKREVLEPEHYNIILKQLTQLNNIGQALGSISGVTAMTDVTGFGLAGHLIEMAEGSGLTAILDYSVVKKVEGIEKYLALKTFPDAIKRNWESYGFKVSINVDVNYEEAIKLLPDPQTNGGLLIAVEENACYEVIMHMKQYGLEDFINPIGRLTEKGKDIIIVNK